MIETQSPGVRRFAAIGLALAVVLFVTGYVIEPAARRLADLDGQITAQRELLGRQSTLAAESPVAIASVKGSRQFLKLQIYLPGETEPIQLANLQASIRQMSDVEGVRLQSTRTLPSVQRDDVYFAGLQMTLKASIESLQRLLHRIEVHRPVLTVDGLAITPLAASATSAEDDSRLLQVELRVLGYVEEARKDGTP